QHILHSFLHDALPISHEQQTRKYQKLFMVDKDYVNFYIIPFKKKFFFFKHLYLRMEAIVEKYESIDHFSQKSKLQLFLLILHPLMHNQNLHEFWWMLPTIDHVHSWRNQ